MPDNVRLVHPAGLYLGLIARERTMLLTWRFRLS